MEAIKIRPANRFSGDIALPGDKSISHRAAIVAALSKGRTKIKNFLFSDDCLATLKVLKDLGVKIRADKKRKEVVIESDGRLRRPASALFMRESGTSARIFLGLLAGQNFESELRAAPSLLGRPMKRVLDPLRLMGASIAARSKGREECLPIKIFPAKLKAIRWRQRVASAQVKSAVLLAGLFAEGTTCIEEPFRTRDHTERMLTLFGAAIRTRAGRITIRPAVLSGPGEITIPGDISSAAFFIVSALLLKDSRIVVKDTGINPTRMGLIRVLRRMGANVKIFNRRNLIEPIADIEAKTSVLKGTTILPEEVPALIDELPIFMVAAGLAHGKTVIQGTGELRVKETDRIHSIQYNLSKLGVNIEVKSLKNSETLEIHGIKCFPGGSFKSFSDHRTAMSIYVAALASRKPSTLDDISCVSKSFPEFLKFMNHLIAQ